MGNNSISNEVARGGGAEMFLPKKIKIGVHYYDVIFPYHFKEDNGYFGQIDYALLEIRISDKDTNGNLRPISKVLETFWHEIEHGIDYEYNNDKIAEKFGDDTIKTLARARMQILYDNFLIALPPQNVIGKKNNQEQQVNKNDNKLFTGQPYSEKDAIFMGLWNSYKTKNNLDHIMD